jgi:hypothetical protein
MKEVAEAVLTYPKPHLLGCTEHNIYYTMYGTTTFVKVLAVELILAAR